MSLNNANQDVKKSKDVENIKDLKKVSIQAGVEHAYRFYPKEKAAEYSQCLAEIFGHNLGDFDEASCFEPD